MGLELCELPTGHDLSIEVTGLAAFHAQRFIDFLWSAHRHEEIFETWALREGLSCQAIPRRLLRSSDFVAQIVVSPPQAWAGPQYFTAGGASYSWGEGASGTMRKIVQFINQYASSAQAAHSAYERLFVAPFCFTGVVFDTEEDYVWPGLGKIGDPYPTGINTYPSPANHAKFYMGDDEICYVGSDNLYPNKNTEFGYLIEAGDDGAFADLKKNYWDLVWTYSQPHCVTPSKDFYIRVTCGSDDACGWLAWDGQGYTVLTNVGETDPSKIDQAYFYRFQQVGQDHYLRAPAYGPHYSGSLGGYGTDGV
jgi:hypothetical protein